MIEKITNNKKDIIKFCKKLETLYELFNWTWQDNAESPTYIEIYNLIEELAKELEKDKKASSVGSWWIELTFDWEEYWLEICWRLNKTIYL